MGADDDTNGDQTMIW